MIATRESLFSTRYCRSKTQETFDPKAVQILLSEKRWVKDGDSVTIDLSVVPDGAKIAESLYAILDVFQNSLPGSHSKILLSQDHILQADAAVVKSYRELTRTMLDNGLGDAYEFQYGKGLERR